MLAHCHAGKEWFRCSIEVASAAVAEAVGSSTGGSPLVPGHALADYFQDDAVRSRADPCREAVFTLADSAVPERPVIGDWTYTCRHCSFEQVVASCHLVRCPRCGRTEIVV